MTHPKPAGEPDASFAPRGLPPPSRNNNIKIRPGSNPLYPTFVFEIAYPNGDKEGLLRDADENISLPIQASTYGGGQGRKEHCRNHSLGRVGAENACRIWTT